MKIRLIIAVVHSPRFKYMNFHIFTCNLHFLRVYYELTKWPAPTGLLAQLVEHCTGIAEVMGSNPILASIFSGFHFTVVCTTTMINHIFG